ncbi:MULTISPECIES: 5-oxoprolinase/urea amidolyase family protein [Arthrobacter]|uniref:5-oxoprolinase/urea amidolyase family protein n=2 Tax=Arthrobacter TaxID=1663 RepID=A0ABU9KJQ9_9MICC|nr:5-oxoprolinase/urea amidolyase family protein [Arthrobacter sp. YJM1]MDP5226961.1 5-oxoprolinase/urea amidolyase family protein [Arthrobacter sp. YJM1]
MGRLLGLRRAGDRAVLAELDSLDAVLALQAGLLAEPPAGVVDVVAAARTVLVTVGLPRALAGVAERIRAVDLSAPPVTAGRLVTVEVVYDGEDLADVARLTGVSAEAVVAAHTAAEWTAAFGGFAPGFAYLSAPGVVPVPRRTSPRTRVPAGSVALAGEYSAVYPNDSPGGWQLIGRTGAALWDPSREEPALIQAGDRVRFTAVREVVSAVSAVTSADSGPVALEVLAPGLQTLIQDLGRPGHASSGVSESGAMDRGALKRANRMVGNPAGSPGLETLLGGLRLRAAEDVILAVTGARVPLTITTAEGAEASVAMDCPFPLLAGESLELGMADAGLRSYVAVRAGVRAETVLGSAASDVLSGLGPSPVAAGTRLGVLCDSISGAVGSPEAPAPLPGAVTELRVVPGPRAEWFTDESVEAFFSQEWKVTAESNRVGIRLAGEWADGGEGPGRSGSRPGSRRGLTRAVDGELQSEGTVRGAVQVPASGLPLVFMADHPVTGGYPVIGVVLDADQDRMAQLPPGSAVRFVRAEDGGCEL